MIFALVKIENNQEYCTRSRLLLMIIVLMCLICKKLNNLG